MSITTNNNHAAAVAVVDEFYNPLLYHNNVGTTSFNTILYRRMEGRIRSVAFHNIIKRQQQSFSIYNNNSNNVYIPDPSLRIYFPNHQKHNNSNRSNNTISSSSSSSLIHTTLDVCNESRFLLCGNNHGMISIFDLSPWGSKANHHKTQHQNSLGHLFFKWIGYYRFIICKWRLLNKTRCVRTFLRE